MHRFAADTKLGGVVDSLEGRKTVQRDLDRSEHQVIVNSMKINESKCRILCLGRSKARQRYRLGEEPHLGDALHDINF